MKTIIITLSIILISLTLNADDDIKSIKFISGNYAGVGIGMGVKLTIVCVDGYKYVIASGKDITKGISITQMFEESRQIGTATQPIKCKK